MLCFIYFYNLIYFGKTIRLKIFLFVYRIQTEIRENQDVLLVYFLNALNRCGLRSHFTDVTW